MGPLKIFIGSGEASLLERKTLIYSLKKNCKKYPLDIFVFNGTHNSIEYNDRKPVLSTLPLEIKYQNITEFSNYRWLIPEICKYQGKAIWVDSDTICLTDIAELFEMDMEDYDFMAKPSAYDKNCWGLSVLLIDCAKTKFDMKKYFEGIAQGLYSYADLHQMTSTFLKYHPFNIGPLDPNWNSFDNFSNKTKLIHYTNLHTQPWKHPNHTHGNLWFKYFNEARLSGDISNTDIQNSIDRSYVRLDILEGNTPSVSKAIYKRFKYHIKNLVKRGIRL